MGIFRTYRKQTEASRLLASTDTDRIDEDTKDSNGQRSPFTDRFTSKDKRATGKYVFDVSFTEMGIEHRLSPPRHLLTNGMVERFNGRISSGEKIPQRALYHLTPIQPLKKWYTEPQIYLLNAFINRRDLTKLQLQLLLTKSRRK